jgi:hypothetical protein
LKITDLSLFFSFITTVFAKNMTPSTTNQTKKRKRLQNNPQTPSQTHSSPTPQISDQFLQTLIPIFCQNILSLPIPHDQVIYFLQHSLQHNLQVGAEWRSQVLALSLWSAYLDKLKKCVNYDFSLKLDETILNQIVTAIQLILETQNDPSKIVSDHIWDYFVLLFKNVPLIFVKYLHHLIQMNSPDKNVEQNHYVHILCRLVDETKVHFLFRQNLILCQKLYQALEVPELVKVRLGLAMILGDQWKDPK